jgi:stage II sporulation protein E
MYNLKSEILSQKKVMNFLFDKNYLIILPIALLLGRGQLIRGLMPFGLPFYIAIYQLDVSKITVAVFVLLGMITAGGKQRIYVTVAGMIIFSILNLLNKFSNKKSPAKCSKSTKSSLSSKYNSNSKTYIGCAVMGLISSLIPELVAVFNRGMLLYDFIIAIFSSLIVFVLVFIFSNTVSLLDRNSKTYVFSDEEFISLVISCALIFCGFGDIKILGFDIKNIVCILAIMILSYRYGAALGAAIGVTAGLVLSMSSSNLSSSITPILIGCYAFCGLLSGVFRNLGKVGSGLGFFIGNTMLILYMNGSMEALIYLKEVVLAVCIFIIIPRKFILSISDLIGTNFEPNIGKATISLRAKEMIVEKLNKFSTAFMEVAKTFSEVSTTKTIIHKHDISSMFDRIVDRVCKDCSLCLHCWDRNFYSTYQVMFKIVERLEQKGYIESGDIPSYFIERCERINEFVQVVNNMYEIFKVDIMWRSKLGENRNLLSQQLEELSKAISGLALEIDYDAHFKTEFENTLLIILKREGIRAAEVLAIENKYGKYEVNISHKGCGGRRCCNTVINKIVSDVVGRKMVKDTYGCSKKDSKNSCILKFVEQEKYSITTGVATISKYDELYGNNISGDNYTFTNSSDGKYVLAISDGMGSGEKASMQSRATINLIEKFMESGFDKDATVKLINSILALKSNDDYFSTIDLCLINLNDGEIEFMKIGAAPTVIKRKEVVDIIKTISLPAGILSNMEIELIHKQLNDGDMVILISDGVIDAFESEDGNREKAFCKFVREIKSINPQAVADAILDEAYKNSQGKPLDDMTVIVAKFWKKAV